MEQLEIWANRVGAQFIKHTEGSDPSAVAFDSIKAAFARDVDVVFIDTAGRLHTKVNLMEEMKKLRRILGRECPGAPHETLLVLDATNGQNAISQAKLFHETIGITGIALTKLDGTAKGGTIIGITEELKIPIRYIGVGEGIDDLKEFSADEFAGGLNEGPEADALGVDNDPVAVEEDGEERLRDGPFLGRGVVGFGRFWGSREHALRLSKMAVPAD